jgi:hypothetical protein
MTMSDLPAPPEAPHAQSCCGRWCSPCIFDYYDDAFTSWETEIRALGFAPEAVLAAIGQTRAARPY